MHETPRKEVEGHEETHCSAEKAFEFRRLA
jgi:hypothetical protein